MKTTLKFMPLLLLYIFIIMIFSDNSLFFDESRYLMFANNLSHGYYSPHTKINLWNGPGYPLILLPIVLLKLPWLCARLLNALFFFGAVLFFNRTLRLYLEDRPAFYFSYLLGLYPLFIRHLPLLYTETLVLFLICGFIFYFCRANRSPGAAWVEVILAGVFAGYLALTKVFFGHVLLLGLVAFAIFYGWKKKKTFKKTSLVYLLALVVCSPYLLYTYSLTGKIFYWGDAGGLSLYCMSTPFKEELGDYFGPTKIEDNLPWIKNHEKFFNEEIFPRPPIQQDEVFKKQAIRNILDHPMKIFMNWLANIGRLLFNYPYSYTSQKLSTYIYMIPNMFLVVMMAFSIYPTYRARKWIPFEIYALLAFGLLAFGGSSLLSAYVRQFLPLIPICFLWVIFVWMNVVKIEIK
ncbi:MAG: glycosyltransferase family 39 protein [Thermodesulfobacteriota bacterium]|jgi:4-amino-4-deoxy-L-arabinose transferase-like glycosyltransferase